MKNVPIKDELHKRLKIEAVINGVTITSMLEEAIEDILKKYSSEDKK